MIKLVSALKHPLRSYKAAVEIYYYWRCLNSRGFALRFFRRYLPAEFLAKVSNKVLFDFGCGNGRVMMMGANLGMYCAGFDVVDYRYQKILKSKRPNQVKFIVGDFNQFLNTNLDDVALFTFIQVYEFMADANRDDVFYKASEFLMPGGYLLFQTINSENIYTLLTGNKFNPLHTVFPYPPKEYFYGIFQKCKLEVVKESYEGFKHPIWHPLLLPFFPYMNTLCLEPSLLWKMLAPEKRGFINFLLRKRRN
jgi:SAM-dependent methyltransferase